MNADAIVAVFEQHAGEGIVDFGGSSSSMLNASTSASGNAEVSRNPPRLLYSRPAGKYWPESAIDMIVVRRCRAPHFANSLAGESWVSAHACSSAFTDGVAVGLEKQRMDLRAKSLGQHTALELIDPLRHLPGLALFPFDARQCRLEVLFFGRGAVTPLGPFL